MTTFSKKMMLNFFLLLLLFQHLVVSSQMKHSTNAKKSISTSITTTTTTIIDTASTKNTTVTTTRISVTTPGKKPLSTVKNNIPNVSITTIGTKHQFSNATTTTTPMKRKKIPSGAICHSNTSLDHDKDVASNYTCHSYSKPMKCFHDPMNCNKHFKSGKRTAFEVPAFGEYEYLTQKRWFPIILQGGIAFLYHPCTHADEKEKLRVVANSCLRRYILSPSEALTEDKPIALVTWGCFYTGSFVNATDMKSWLRKHSLRGPASNTHRQGKYEELLKQKSSIVTDEKDSIICPTSQEIRKFIGTTMITRTIKMNHNKIAERILNNRLKNIQEKHHQKSRGNNTVKSMKVHPGNATWAAFSLVFICGILGVWLIYTLFWAPKEKTQTYDYEQVMSIDTDHDYGGGGGNAFSASGGFSLLKSSQQVINIFKSSRQKREKKLDSLSTVNLMVPINEDEEEFDEELDT